ncbi:hypothetical protein PsorP6_010941 [Peronosclerospora sorghi]|uniref:Uncharacterized protein n=1 Tax=Peronosclerospora sorghi TaxID=230839 RepID=A0ACC0VW76_9STRA|nr:hypothetical protein PsorP6_010941 [Peronosclerospora sorghi]
MLLEVASGTLSKYLTLEHASLPTLQSTCLYVMLAVVYCIVRFIRKTPWIGVPWWFYTILAVVDVEDNYFAVKAYNYANYATTRYSFRHYLGALIAMGGSIVIFVSDFRRQPMEAGVEKYVATFTRSLLLCSMTRRT